MKKIVIIVIVVVGIGVAAYYVRNNTHKSGPATGSPSRPTTAEVIQTNISFAVNAAGEIGPAEQVSVRPEINGKIDKLPVDIGDQVKKGDLLFKLDDKGLQQERESNLTAIERAKLGCRRRSVISNARSNCSPSGSSPRNYLTTRRPLMSLPRTRWNARNGNSPSSKSGSPRRKSAHRLIARC
jgi:hypothetical protein